MFNALHIELAAHDLRCVAAVREDFRVIDYAVSLPASRFAIVRHVERSISNDYTALARMVSQGDFIWGALIYEQGEAHHPLGLVASFHIGQLDRLVARLVQLREACGEAS